MGILTLITVVPFVAVGIIMLLPAERLKTIKQVSLVAAGIDVALAVWLVFDALERVGDALAPPAPRRSGTSSASPGSTSSASSTTSASTGSRC